MSLELEDQKGEQPEPIQRKLKCTLVTCKRQKKKKRKKKAVIPLLYDDAWNLCEK